FFEPAGQGEHVLSYDDAGDFFPTVVDALLRPHRLADGGYVFTWMQGGGELPATRRDAGGDTAPAAVLSDAELGAYVGEYPLMPGFALSVRARDGRLYAQATGQGEFPLDAAAADTFEAAAFGIRIVFKRGDDGAVASLDLHQGGQALSGARGG